MGLDLLAPWMALVGIKDFRWSSATRDVSQRPRWQWQYCPLGEGQAHLPEFIAYLKRLSYDGIVSLHSEYKGESSFRRLATPELLRQSAADLKYVRSLLVA